MADSETAITTFSPAVAMKVELVCGACSKLREMSMDACPNCGDETHSFAFRDVGHGQ